MESGDSKGWTGETQPVHFGKPGRHCPHVLWRPFLVILMDSEAFIRDKQVKYGIPCVKISINKDEKPQQNY